MSHAWHARAQERWSHEAQLVDSARLDGHICAAFAERVPARRADLTVMEALAELASRYFTGHGPVPEHDLACWGDPGAWRYCPRRQARDGLSCPPSITRAARSGTLTGSRPPTRRLLPAGHLLQRDVVDLDASLGEKLGPHGAVERRWACSALGVW